MIILGIDPAYSKPHTVCIIRDEIVTLIYKSDNLNDIMASIKSANKVFIEDQYFGMNPNTTLRLGQATGELMALCELNSVQYEMVYPTKWMSYFGISTRRPKGMGVYKWKKQHYQDIINKAHEYTDLKIEDEDFGASVLIGLYGVNNETK